MKKRKLKFFSLILSLILVLVSVPMSVVSEETTDEQDNLSVTKPNDELVEQSSFEEITEIQSYTNNVEPGDIFVSQEFENTNSTRATTSQQIVYFPDGIYAFENFANTGWYMCNPSDTSEFQLVQYQYPASPTIQNVQSGLFKVTKISGTNTYSIRCMNNLNYAIFMDNDGSVKTKNVGQSDLTLPSGCIFGITSHNNSYVIYNISLQRCISADGTNPHLNSTTMNTSGLLYNYYARWIPRGYRTYIEDGVYALQNVNTGLWMDTQYNSYESGKYAQQYNYSQCPADTFSRGGLFKIKQIGDTGRYTVRLMTNNLLTWNVNGGGFKSYKINSVDSAVSVQNTFYIVFDGTGFVLIQCQNNYAMASLANSNASGSAGAPDSYLRRVAKTEIQDNARWNLYKYTGADKCGVTVISNESLTEFNSTGAVAGSTYTFESAVWYTYSSINDNVIVVTPSNSNVADVVWNNSNYTTTITVKNFGKLSFDVSIWRASSGAPQTLYGARYSYNAVPKEGTYYLQNKYSQKYADIEGPSTADGAVIQQWEFSTASQKKWQVEHVSGSGGYVRFKSLFSNKYLSVDPNDSTKIKQYSSPGDNGLWRFELLDDYSVKVICKSTESSGKVLAVPLNSTGNGVDITQRTYTDNSDYSDEWIISPNRYQFYIDHYYDIGYSVRFSEINPNVDELISSYQDYVSEFFATTFDVEIKFTCQQYTSPADICAISQYGSVNDNNLISNCPHPHTDPNNTDPLHTTRTALKESLSTGNNTNSIVIWTGHILDGNPVSCAFNYTVVMTPYHTTKSYDNYANKSDEDVYFYSIRSLIHELSHQLGAPDHYCRKNGKPCSNENCDICYKDYIYTRKCVMGDTDDFSVDNPEKIYCSECISTILAHLNEHH